MKIGIDARFLTHPQAGGFKTYTENLVRTLAEVDRENQYVLYLDREPGDGHGVLRFPNFSIRIVAGRLPALGMPWREQVALPRQVSRDRVDLLHSPSQTAPLMGLGCISVLTVHDAIWMSPARFSRGRSWTFRRAGMEQYHRFVATRAARGAAAIITVSHAARAEIVTRLKLDPARVFVTHEAADRRFRPADAGEVEAARRRHGVDSAFILALGSADPRKNVGTLLGAYAQMPPSVRAEYELVIVWAHPALAADVARKVESLGLIGRIRFLQRVSTGDLALLYNAASLFVFPSLCEGFGLPILEAMGCGTPVVAANNSSIPEVAGDAALLVDALDVPGLSSAMARVLADAGVRARLRQNGLARAATFSWAACARETVAVYRHAAAAAGGSAGPALT